MGRSGTEAPFTFDELDRIDELIELAERPALVLVDEPTCARCGTDVDDEGFCALCGAVTIAGELRAAP